THRSSNTGPLLHCNMWNAAVLWTEKACTNRQTTLLSCCPDLPSARWRLANRSSHLMPLRLTLLESLLSRFNLLPTPLFDTPLAAGIAQVLVTSCELGIFDTLSKGPLSLEALAETLACCPQRLQLVLQLLVSAGYLRQRKGKYANTRTAQRWLTCGSPVNIAPYVVH